jgi:hypothetical protein
VGLGRLTFVWSSMYACTKTNLGDRGRRVALQGGVFFAGVSLLTALVVFEFQAARPLGWILALPIALSVYGLVSGSLGLCVYHGMKGVRRADHGAEVVLDHESRARMRMRALVALSASLLAGFAFAAAFVASL